MKEDETKVKKMELQPALRLLEPEESLSDKEEARQQLLRDKWKLYFYENGRYVEYFKFNYGVAQFKFYIGKGHF